MKSGFFKLHMYIPKWSTKNDLKLGMLRGLGLKTKLLTSMKETERQTFNQGFVKGEECCLFSWLAAEELFHGFWLTVPLWKAKLHSITLELSNSDVNVLQCFKSAFWIGIWAWQSCSETNLESRLKTQQKIYIWITELYIT